MLYDSVEVVDVEGIVSYVKGLQKSDGSFMGDKWGEPTASQTGENEERGAHLPASSVSAAGEVDTRFSFCSLASLALLVSYCVWPLLPVCHWSHAVTCWVSSPSSSSSTSLFLPGQAGGGECREGSFICREVHEL